jgi:cell division protease FtsH
MSEVLGTVNYDGHKRGFLDIQAGPERGAYAEDTAQQIDSEVRRIMDQAHAEARRILSDKKDVLESMSRRLLQEEVIDGIEVRRMLGVLPPADGDTQPIVQPSSVH